MESTQILSASEALAELAPLIPVIYQALEIGAQKACEYFEQEEKDLDTSLAPSIVRFQAKHYLDEHGHEAIQEEDYDREGVRNNGLAVFYRGIHLRIWKASHDKLPAGLSKSRQEFFAQQLTLFPSENASVLQPTKLNLIILWNTTSAYTLTELRLICPKKSGKTLDSIETHWDELIPLPIPQEQPMMPNTVDEDDLGISLPEDHHTAAEEGE